MAVADWISRLFAGGAAKGLSGDAEDMTLDPRSTYFASRLRRHHSSGDLIEDPSQIWSSDAQGRKRDGLRAHLLGYETEGPADFADVLVVVNEADFKRGLSRLTEPWTETASRVVGIEFEHFCSGHGFERLFNTRPAPIRVLADGGPEMGGEEFGLQPGEFVTGLVPNFYDGPSGLSRPVIAIHLNLPDVWDEYREVGRLYSDQVVFTLGNHWLDNFSHFTLQEPSLYRLQQYLDGSFVHIIDPDLQHLYHVVSDDSEGANVLSILDVNGEPVAHLVLALVDSVVEEPQGELGERPTVPVLEPLDVARPAISLHDVSLMGHKTIIPESVQERIFTLKERGALLQKVHFDKFMQGYDVYVSAAGTLSTRCSDRAATFQVRANQVSLVVHKADVQVNGSSPPLEVASPLYQRTKIKVGTHSLVYNDLTQNKDTPGWPYLGEIIRSTSSTHMVFGGRYRIGRDRRCKVQLPDEPHNDNIAWLPSMEQGATIRARSGPIPKSRFYTDSIMVASEHAEVDLATEPSLHSVARHCYCYVRRNGGYTALYPTKHEGPRKADLVAGDEILVGNCLFQVQYSEADPAGATTPPPSLSPDILASAVEGPSDPDMAQPAPASFGMAGAQIGMAGAQIGMAGSSATRSASHSRPPKAPVDAGSVDRLAKDPPPVASSSLDILLNARQDRMKESSLNHLLGGSNTAPDLDDVGPTAIEGDDIPASAGLPETGVAPPPPRLTMGGYDSLLGIEAPDKSGGMLARHAPDPNPPDATKKGESSPSFLGGEDRTAVAEPLDVPPMGGLGPPPPREAPAPVEPEAEPARENIAGEVLFVDEDMVQVELARPARLVQLGWALSGEITVGNHVGCEVVIPENRVEDGQEFVRTDYFSMKVRGSRGRASVLDADEARLLQSGAEVDDVKGLDSARFEVVRRDADGDEDFVVNLATDPSVEVPDPRGRLLAIDHSDRIVTGLFTIGLPLRTPRMVQLGRVTGQVLFDGERVTLTDYLTSYRRADGGFEPFFVRSKEGPFNTVPEDGRAIVLKPGDCIIAGTAVFRFDQR